MITPASDARIRWIDSSSCSPQSQRCEPNTSPVRHCEWSRTSAGRPPPTLPLTNARCSRPSTDVAEDDRLEARHSRSESRHSTTRCTSTSLVRRYEMRSLDNKIGIDWSRRIRATRRSARHRRPRRRIAHSAPQAASRRPHQVDRALGASQPHHDAAGQRHQRQNVAGHHDIRGGVFRICDHLDSARAVGAPKFRW